MAKKIGIPWEFKYELAIKGWGSLLKGFLYALRNKYGAAEAKKIVEMVYRMDDRVKNLTNFLRTVFKIEGNDVEAIAKWWDVWYECTGFEFTWLERTKTYNRMKITKCPWKTGYKDIGDWCLIWCSIVYNTLNPKATLKQTKGMCAGDPHCEFITRIEE